MACYHPLTGYRSREVNPKTGKRSVVFNQSKGFVDLPVTFACGQCIGCRLARSRNWAVRCYHEAQCHSRNSFLTLTYANEFLPANGSLVLSDFQKFMKKLRKRTDERIRFFHCGEYGERFKRPHYHACIFGFDFDDRVHWSTSNGHRLYVSEELRNLWPYGHSTIGEVTFDSAAYVARYITKKITGDMAEQHYAVIDEQSGEYFGQRRPEYVTMSRRPGIGRDWLTNFSKEVYPSDFVVVDGLKVKPPRYYDSQFEQIDPDTFSLVSLNRKLKQASLAEHNTAERLAVREEIQLLRFNQLKRGYESEA